MDSNKMKMKTHLPSDFPPAKALAFSVTEYFMLSCNIYRASLCTRPWDPGANKADTVPKRCNLTVLGGGEAGEAVVVKGQMGHKQWHREHLCMITTVRSV